MFEKPEISHRFLAIEGNIGAGKTTLCELLAEKMGARLLLEQFTDNPFLPFFYEDRERYAFPVELFFMAERHKQLQEHFAESDLFQSRTVADYFFIKTLLFAKNNLSEAEFRLFQRLWAALNSTFPKPDLLVFLHRPVEILLRQISKRGRDFEKNISPEYLASLEKAYFDFFKTAVDVPIVVIDLGETNYLADEAAFLKIVSILGREFENGTHFLTI